MKSQYFVYFFLSLTIEYLYENNLIKFRKSKIGNIFAYNTGIKRVMDK